MDNLTPITREEILMNDEPLTPITREEKILAGEDLTPVTRREYFLKKYRHTGGDVMVEGLSVTENGTYTAPEGKAYSPVEVNVPMPENAYLLKEASGSLVSFSDGADLPMPSFICNIDAVQDLHGQDAPWVGGAGKNKARTYTYTGTNAGVTFSYDDNGVTLSGTAANNVSIPFSSSASDFTFPLKAGTHTVSITPAKEGVVPQIVKLSTGTVVSNSPTFTISEDMDVYYRVAVTSGTVSDGTYKIQLESGSTATEFAPYSNICPISGHTGLDAVISPTTEASAGTTYSVNWQTEAGEVFGGYVDLVSGVLTVDRYCESFNGSENWEQESADNCYSIKLRGTLAKWERNAFGMCNLYQYNGTVSGASNMNNEGLYYWFNNTMLTPPNNRYAMIRDNTKSTLEEFKTYLSTNNLQVVYELATPQTYQLTPTQIKSLLGNNNAWCDTGDVDIDYFAKEVEG